MKIEKNYYNINNNITMKIKKKKYNK